MTTINPKKEELYNSEDKKILISLLGEYSSKLLGICEKIDIYQRRNIVYVAVLIGALFPLMVLLVIFITNRLEDILKRIWLSATIAILFVSILFAGTFFSQSEVLYNNGKLKLLKQDARVTATKLEKVIRLASQLQDHVLNNIISELELDLRLTDAESTLQYYSNIKNKRMF